VNNNSVAKAVWIYAAARLAAITIPQRDGAVTLFHIYARRFRRHLVGKTLRIFVTVILLKDALWVS